MRNGRLKVVFLMVIAVVLAGAGTARAVDAPKWVAALYVQAQNSVGLRWAPVPGATGFKVLRSVTKGADYKEVAAPTAPQAFDAAIEAGTTYYYVLQAVAGAEVSANSDERSVSIPGQKRVALTAPEVETPTVTSTTEFGKTTFRAAISWRAVPQAVAYNLYKSTESGKNYALLLSGAENRVVDVQVEAGKTYYYVVTAMDDQFQETPYSKEVSAAPKMEEHKEKKAVAVSSELMVQPSKLLRRLGANDPGLERLNNPNAVAVSPGGTVYVTDTVANRVRMYDSAGNFIKIIGQEGTGENPGDLRMPSGLVFYDGRLYVLCGMINIVQVFAEDGTPKKAIAITDPTYTEEKLYITAFGFRPDGTAFAGHVGKNKFLMELDDKFVATRRIPEAATADGTKVKMSGAFQFAFDSAGDLFVPAGINFTMHAFNQAGENYLNFGAAGDVAGKFLRLLGVAVDPKDRVWTTDIATGNVQVFDGKTGGFLFALGGEKEGDPLGLTSPMGITIDKQGTVYITEGMSGEVAVLKPIGEPYKVDLKKVKH